jgi:hypothetical protein
MFRDGAQQVFLDHAQRLHRPDIADRIRALVGGPQRRAIRQRPFVERHRGVRLERVAQDVEAG